LIPSIGKEGRRRIRKDRRGKERKKEAVFL
jgi:hypothetical protein